MVPVRIVLTIWKKCVIETETKYLGFMTCEKIVSFPCLPAAQTVCHAVDESFEIEVPTFDLIYGMYEAEGSVDCVIDDTPDGEQQWIKYIELWDRFGFTGFESYACGDA